MHAKASLLGTARAAGVTTRQLPRQQRTELRVRQNGWTPGKWY